MILMIETIRVKVILNDNNSNDDDNVDSHDNVDDVDNHDDVDNDGDNCDNCLNDIEDDYIKKTQEQ